MCSDENCKCMDECCCPLKSKSLFACIWTLAHAGMALILEICELATHSLLLSIFKDNEMLAAWFASNNVLCAFTLTGTIVCLIGAVLQLIGHLKLNRCLYLVGLILSSIFSFLSYPYFFYTIVVQIFCIIWCCRFYRLEM
ncbi:uncharacterized protein LOC108602660 [Drosophila busckii]|uniref:uncharacterized protein LOC108602660 n=1 Tax=Drosophila busckii TaxID=30019 RepID=UPI00083F3077|nr:uncharacterized protein LOC108602660 [Drosophila busckii]